MEDLKYPIGRFEGVAGEIESRIRDIAELPGRMRIAVSGLAEHQIDRPYREGGWTIRQVVHHVADSHMNGYTRCKLSLTEDSPTIKPYEEKAWAQIPDSKLPLDASLQILDGVHERWTVIWKSLESADFEKTFVHPDHGKQTLDWLLSMYSWHSRHHVAHIANLRTRMGW